ncbi:unnamed protein product [Cylindrotheca closterium]|uniref:Histone deacetylase domain-containing protein n=1 Tax=Cylindrotheca closterium TaxID=2856 RepID=A0AAD2CQ00_9STRA|nr:unnamed protein product [Cylindrotheca closterium]
MITNGSSIGSIVVTFVSFYLYPIAGLNVPIWFDSSNGWHRSIDYHPEQPARIDACVKEIQRLKESQQMEGTILIDTTPDTSTLWKDCAHEHQPFSEEELHHARDILLKTHDEEMVLTIEGSCSKSRDLRISEGKDPLGFIGNIDEDTFLTTESFDVCLRATAAWIRAVDHAFDKKQAAFALTRPPGHHATFQLSNGFCIVNFAAAAVVHLLESHDDIKVSVFDWDVHYGQGVAKIIQKYSRARYVSIHQTPAFPYMGNKLGVSGEHLNVMTIPIPAETTWTCGYKEKFEEKVLPFVCSDNDSWKPNLVLICAGYDALDSDELASVSLQAKDYKAMASRLVKHLRENESSASIALGLEGGYQLSEFAGGGNLPNAVTATIQGLTE